MRTIFALAAALLVHAAPAVALEASSGQRQVTLVELFTSEGCSSCPPAEAWMNKLRDDPRLWREVVPVAFHVDYWDYIGWPDTFAVPANSERQREYRRQGLISSVYTPGLVSNGREWRGWFRHPVLDTSGKADAGTLSISVDGDRFSARYSPSAGATTRGLMLNVARLGFSLSTKVSAGENHGRTLDHEFVVLGFKQLPLTAAADAMSAAGTLPDARVSAPKQGVAVWVSQGRSLAPLQATGGFLND